MKCKHVSPNIAVTTGTNPSTSGISVSWIKICPVRTENFDWITNSIDCTNPLFHFIFCLLARTRNAYSRTLLTGLGPFESTPLDWKETIINTTSLNKLILKFNDAPRMHETVQRPWLCPRPCWGITVLHHVHQLMERELAITKNLIPLSAI